jgi:proteasome lid subunit RPN8/RPN11
VTTISRKHWAQTEWDAYYDGVFAEARARVYGTTGPLPKRRNPIRPRGLVLAPQARMVMGRDLWERRAAYAETGGPLHGSDQGDTAIVVTKAGVWPDETSARARGMLVYRPLDAIDEGDLVGTWHSHGLGGRTQPSDGDLRDAASLLDDVDRRSVVMVVVSYDHESMLARGFFDTSAYLVEKDPSGQVTYEAMGGAR